MIGWLKRRFRRKPEIEVTFDGEPVREIRGVSLKGVTVDGRPGFREVPQFTDDLRESDRWGEPHGTEIDRFELLQIEAQDIAPGDYTRMAGQHGKDRRWQFFQDVTVLGDEVRCSILRPDRSIGMVIYAYGQHIEVARPNVPEDRPVWGVLSDWLSGRRR